MDTNYDSTADTLTHIKRVNELLLRSVQVLLERARKHDQSKLQEPEKSGFDQVSVKLGNMTYGTPEYAAALLELQPILQHHYANNSHHPEHYPNGINGFDLFDLLEMTMDWKAATERMRGGTGDIRKSLEINTERYKIDPQLKQILLNTINRVWPANVQPNSRE